MIMKTAFFILACNFLWASTSWAAPLRVGETPTVIKLDAELGGKVSGAGWSSEEISKSGKIVSLFYVDPEEKKLNEPVETAYEAAKFPTDKHASVAVINMAAAWYPNSMINNQLKSKQEKFPRTIYVKDMKKTLVKEWGLKDDSVNLVIFGRDGKPLFMKQGAMTPAEITEAMNVIRSNL
jgi:predicted transcriptional regulator